jgi:polyphosphate kinase 2 (PPK2 family)
MPYAKSTKQYKDLLQEQHGEAEFAAAASLRLPPLCVLLIFQGWTRRQGRRHPARDVRRQSAGLRGVQLQTAERRGVEHDFLWRTTRRLPERGRIGIFNRSYYEEVLVVRVHPEILRGQGLPEELRDEKNIWEQRLPLHRQTWRSTFIATARASSRSSCICPRRSSESASSRASTSRTRTGNSASDITSGNSGSIT